MYIHVLFLLKLSKRHINDEASISTEIKTVTFFLICRHCLLPCDRSNEVCPEGARYADILEFKLVALPNGIPAYQDLIRLIAYDQYRNHLSDTTFVILENDKNAAFGIRLEDGKGVVYTLQPLEERRQYQIKVRAKSYDSRRRDIQYQTTFMIYISVSLYPY